MTEQRRVERRKFDAGQLLVAVVRSLVDQPDAVDVSETKGTGYLMLTLRTAPGDASQVIGRGGRMARSLRTMLSGAGRKLGVRIDLNIVDGRGADDPVKHERDDED